MSRSQISQSLLIETETLNELHDLFPSLKEEYIERSNVQEALKVLGFPLPGYEFREMMKDIPESLDKIPIEMFMMLHAKVKESKDIGRTFQQRRVLKERVDVKTVTKEDEKSTHAKHTVCDSEERGFSNWISRVLSKDPLCSSYLPIKQDELYSKLQDGVLLCKLINSAVPDTVDERVMNTGTSLKSVFKKNENLSLAVNSAEAIGCCMVNIGPEDIDKGTKHLVLGLVWQVIRIGLLGLVNLLHHAELVALLREDETLDDLKQLTPEELLLRWVNYHLEKAGITKRITNFKEDIQDSEIYSHLLYQIAPPDKRDEMLPPVSILTNTDNMKRAELMLGNAAILDARVFIEPEDVAMVTQRGQNREKLNLAFVANLFNNYPALIVDSDIEIREETLEEKTYRNWMNSMGVTPYVKDIYSDLKNGLVLLQLIDLFQPGIVEWKKIVRVFDPKKKVFQMLGNCSYVIEYAKKLNFNIVNLSADNIKEATPNLVLGLCFQMLRNYTMKLLSKVLPGKKDDKDIIAWANLKTKGANKSCQISSFRDPSIATSKPILDLIDAIVPNSVDFKLLTNEPLQDAKFTISQARRIGARIYALPQHLVDVNQKMVMTVYACLMLLDHQINSAKE